MVLGESFEDVRAKKQEAKKKSGDFTDSGDPEDAAP